MLSGTILLLAAAPAYALTKVAVLGPGDPWVSLNAAKTAHRQGLTSSIACNKPAEARKMLWGADLSSEDEAKIKVVEGSPIWRLTGIIIATTDIGPSPGSIPIIVPMKQPKAAKNMF